MPAPNASAEQSARRRGQGARRLVSFGVPCCGAFLDYVRPQAARLVGPYGLGGGPAIETRGGPIALPSVPAQAAAPADKAVAGVDYSGTNVQEEGVDEPDLVKTDGKTLFVVANGRINAVDVSERQPRLLDSLRLENVWSAQLLLHGNRLLVLTYGGYVMPMLPGLARSIAPYQPSNSTLTEIDVSAPKALRVVRTLKLDGTYVAARLVGGTARIVISSYVPQALPFERPDASTSEAAARERNQAIVASSKTSSWVPKYRLRNRRTGRVVERSLVQCRHIRRPEAFSGLGLLTVLTVDLAKGLEPVNSASIMTDGRIVYASPESLYVATERWATRPDPAKPTDEPEGVRTAIHKFDISDPERAVYRGSGTVSGFLLSQWSLSEHRGVLRVVSTDAPAWWGVGNRESESALTTLRARDGALVQAGRVAGLGKGERVYAVRFVGDVGYVVTFRQIDPLYTIDLADPDRPRVLGELKIPGLLRVPASDRRELAPGRRSGRDGGGPADRHTALALRRLRSAAADEDPQGVARDGVVRGGVGSSRLPLLAPNRPGGRAVLAAGRCLPRRSCSRHRSARSDRPRSRQQLGSGHTGDRSSCATPC